MSEWTELTWTAISLIIATIILGIIFNFVGLGKDLQTQMYEDQATVAKLQELRTIAPYDGTTLSGSEVMSAMLELTGEGIPTVCLIRNVKEYEWGKTPCCGIITYNEGSTVEKARNVFAPTDAAEFDAMDYSVREVVKYAFASESPTNKNILQRVSNKQYTTAAFVANADSFFYNTTFSDWKFKSEVIVKNGTLLGVYFKRITYRQDIPYTVDNWADEVPNPDDRHIKEWVVCKS